MSTNQIPNELKELNIWHCWKLVNGQKLPVQKNGEPARSNTPDTWTSFDEAQAAAKVIGGLALEIVEPYCGIDLDDCINDAGEVRPWAREIIDRFTGLAYAEISPSGQGIKLLTRARKTPGARCRHNFHEKQQVECYDNRRFWTVTGDVFEGQSEVGNGQAAVDWLCDQYLSQKTQPREDRILPTGSALRDRARAYVDSVPYDGGGRNNAAFSLAGHLYSMVGDLGERLCEAEVLSFVQGWNARLGEPLPGQEVRTAVSSAGKNGTAREPKYSGVSSPFPDVDISMLTESSCPPTKGLAMNPKANLPDDLCFPEGIIGVGARHMMSTSEYRSPEFFLAAMISLVSAVAGRKVVDYRGTQTNTYLVCLGQTGCGKERGRRFLQDALDGTNLVVADKFTSETAIANQLVISPSCLSLPDEFGKYIEATCRKNQSGPLAEVAAAMMSLYTSSRWSPKAFVDSNRAVTIERPCLSIYGTSTPSTFFAGLSDGDVSSGFLNRMLIFQTPGGGYTKRIRYMRSEIPEQIREFVNYWAEERSHPVTELSPKPEELNISSDARERIEVHFDQIAERRIGEAPLSAAFWSRASEKTSRLALISAISRGSSTIEMCDADWSIAVSNFLTRRTIALTSGNVASTPHELNVLKLLKVVSELGGIAGMTELGRRLRGIPARQRKEIIQQLIECGDLIPVFKSTKGRQAFGVAINTQVIISSDWTRMTPELSASMHLVA